MDNYIRVYGKIGTNPINKAGYLITDTLLGTSDGETLQEKIYYTSNGTDYHYGFFSYVYDTNNTKWYEDSSHNYFRLDADNKKVYATETSQVPVKKIIYIINPSGIDNEIGYQALCDSPTNSYIKKGYIYITQNCDQEHSFLMGVYRNSDKDYSARNYCYESLEFTNWFNDNIANETNWTSNKLGSITFSKIEESGTSKNNPDPSSPDYLKSSFTQHKREVMRASIEESLQRATNAAEAYLGNSSYDYRLPMLNEEEWNQVLSDVSILAFLQGVPIGLKYYNNYAIASSTNNKEYVNPNQIYFSATSGSDEYYHRKGCNKVKSGVTYVGYRSTDYIVKSQNVGTKPKYYYLHDNLGDINSELACYHCIVDNNETSSDALEDEYKLALARERYVQQSH